MIRRSKRVVSVTIVMMLVRGQPSIPIYLFDARQCPAKLFTAITADVIERTDRCNGSACHGISLIIIKETSYRNMGLQC